MLKHPQYLEDLTPPQREAVTHLTGPMLVVAGAGSGKTRVVTRRIAHLVSQGIRPWRILALTFTNKAAHEMRSRVEQLVGEAPAWMGTFHSVCARILRYDLPLLDAGRDNRFTIMDQTDQEALVKQALKKLDIDDKTYSAASLRSSISKAKSDLMDVDDLPGVTPRDRVVQDVFREYESSLRQNNALDFDDLLVMAAKLLENRPEALEKYRARFPFILVDEYQDTNRTQYRLLRALAGKPANLHATGDPDQSIYSWRGADYRNIMDFQKDYPGAKIVRLEENYRSGKFILDVANHLIRHNQNRLEKDLFTARPEGEKVTLIRTQSDRMEAVWIAERIKELRKKGGKLGETAIFYRTNAQSRPLEEALLNSSVPYQLVGGVRFYERKEIKDALSHLKVRVNARDLASLRRLASSRPGIGEKTLDKIALAAVQECKPVFEFLTGDSFGMHFKGKKVDEFARWSRKLAAVDISRADVAVKEIIAHSGLVEATLANAHKDDLAEERVENLNALMARASEFVRLRLENSAAEPAAGDPDATEEEVRASTAIDLAAFLEDVALVADVDGWASGVEKVTLMTLHSAKGLEFDDVFLTGLEEGFLPHRNCRDEAAVEEERRLFYVGITRAKQRAWITYATTRFVNGNFDFSSPSRFLAELPKSSLASLDYGDSLSWQHGSGYGGGVSKAGGGRAGPGAWRDPFVDEEFSDLDVGPDFDPNPDFQPDAVPEPDGDCSPGESAEEFGERPAGKASWPKRPFAGEKGKAASGSGNSSRFRPGDLVRHPRFGSGKILTVEKRKIMVQFFKTGTRLLHEDLSQLTKE